MKRSFAILSAALLVTSLIVPSAAVAANGSDHRGAGNGRTAAPGQAKKVSEEAVTIEAPGGVDMPVTSEEPSDESAKGKGNGNGVAAGKPNQAADAHASENGTSTVRIRVHVRQRESEEGSDTAKPERTGIANAFDRISANLDRANTKIGDSTRKSLPPGLVRVFEKFLGWLGLETDNTPANEADSEQPVEIPDASDDATPTPVPD